jgi:hypothetical protein
MSSDSEKSYLKVAQVGARASIEEADNVSHPTYGRNGVSLVEIL